MAGGLTITLPLPPTANNLFFNLKTGGRAKTAAYKAWQQDARGAILSAYTAAGQPTYARTEKMRLTIRLGMNYASDITNRVKAIEDLLCAALPIPDDRYNDEVSIRRDRTIEGFAHVTLEALG